MSRTIKRNWPLVLILSATLVASSTIWWHHGSQVKAADQAVTATVPASQAPAAVVAAMQANHVDPGGPFVHSVAEKMALTNGYLVAMNLNRDQARTLRSAVRTWCASNKAALAAAFAQPAASRQAQVTQVLTGLEAQIAAVLTPTQLATWHNLRQYQDLPIEFRLAAPSNQQKAKIQKLLQNRWYAGRAAKSEAQRQDLQATFNTELRNTLNGTQMAMIDAYHNYGPAASNVIVEPSQDAISATATGL